MKLRVHSLSHGLTPVELLAIKVLVCHLKDVLKEHIITSPRHGERALCLILDLSDQHGLALSECWCHSTTAPGVRSEQKLCTALLSDELATQLSDQSSRELIVLDRLVRSPQVRFGERNPTSEEVRVTI